MESMSVDMVSISVGTEVISVDIERICVHAYITTADIASPSTYITYTSYIYNDLFIYR